MIDLHCHILPGIDDGPKIVEESIEMAEKAVMDGVTHIVCTPHYTLRYPNTRSLIVPKVQQLQDELNQRDIPLVLSPGQEVHLTGDLMRQLAANYIQFIDQKDRYFLLEFPRTEIPLYAIYMVEKVLNEGKIPIIVHPECNVGFIKEPNKLIPFLELGALAQVTAPSLVGIYGKAIQKTARELLDCGFIHMVASDAHRRQDRDFYLKEAYEWIGQHNGVQKVNEMKEVTEKVLQGESLVVGNYQPMSRKRFWFFR